MYGDLVRCKLRVYAALLCTREWQKEGVCVCVCACVCAHISDAFVKSTHAHFRRAKRDGRLQYKLISFKNEPLFAKPKETC